jgi:DNA polymerase-1
MTAADLLADLRRRGFALAAEGQNIEISPFSLLTPELQQAILSSKAELLALLSREPAADHRGETRDGCDTCDAGGVPAVSYTLVRDKPGLERVRVALEGSNFVGLDTETTGLHFKKDKVRLLSLSLDRSPHAYIIDAFHVDPAPLWPALAARTLVLHNSVFDLTMMAQLGFIPAGKVFDTLILAKVLTAGTRQPCSLKACVKRELGIELPKDLQTSAWASPELTGRQLEYAARDAVATRALYKALMPKIREAGLEKVASLEHAALPAVLWLARGGLAVDRDKLAELARKAEQEAVGACQELDRTAPPCPEEVLSRNRKKERELATDRVFSRARTRPSEGWNWRGGPQALQAMRLAGCDIQSTKAEILAGVDHPLARLLHQYRKANKQVSTYGESWLAAVAPDSRVYPHWSPLQAVTGRMSCSDPNAQQLPKGEHRKAVVAPPGKVLIKADFSQLHLRIAAAVSGDEAMLAAYGEGRDLHTATAQQMTGRQEVTKDERSASKPVNFGTIYGMSSGSLVRYARKLYGVVLSARQAEAYQAAFFRAWPAIQAWHGRLQREVWFDRLGKRKVPEVRSPSGRRVLVERDYWYGGRAAYHVLTREADGFKKTLALLWQRRGQAPGAFPVIFNHDEIVLEAPADQVRAAAEWLTSAMTDGMAPVVSPAPLVVEVTVGWTWGDQLPVEEWLDRAAAGKLPPRPAPSPAAGDRRPLDHHAPAAGDERQPGHHADARKRRGAPAAARDDDRGANARSAERVPAPLKWHGGKSYLAPRIVALMPEHTHYVEPFFGGGRVLLAKDPDGVSEVVSDIDRDLTAFWRVLRDTSACRRFRRLVRAVPFSEAEWQDARDGLQQRPDADPVQRAVWFFIACRQSLAGRMDAFAPLSKARTRRGMNEQASAWLSAVEGLPAVHDRLRRVVIRNKPALDVIRAEDGPGTLFYCDPPYLHETRAVRDTYTHEMSEADHRELLAVLKRCEGKVMLSGYPSELYDKALAGWTRHAFDLPNNAAGGAAKRRQTECVWCNW